MTTNPEVNPSPERCAKCGEEPESAIHLLCVEAIMRGKCRRLDHANDHAFEPPSQKNDPSSDEITPSRSREDAPTAQAAGKGDAGASPAGRPSTSEKVGMTADALLDQRDRFFRDMLVMLSGHRVPTPEKGYGSHGDGYGHILSDVDRALSRRSTVTPPEKFLEDIVHLARLAIAGKADDCRMLTLRMAQRASKFDEGLAERLIEVAPISPQDFLRSTVTPEEREVLTTCDGWTIAFNAYSAGTGWGAKHPNATGGEVMGACERYASVIFPHEVCDSGEPFTQVTHPPADRSMARRQKEPIDE
jgi:hypothetical protein